MGLALEETDSHCSRGLDATAGKDGWILWTASVDSSAADGIVFRELIVMYLA